MYSYNTWTDKERLLVARTMRVPIRCGGLDYRKDGTPVYRVGGKEYPLEEFELLRKQVQDCKT